MAADFCDACGHVGPIGQPCPSCRYLIDPKGGSAHYGDRPVAKLTPLPGLEATAANWLQTGWGWPFEETPTDGPGLVPAAAARAQPERPRMAGFDALAALRARYPAGL